MQPKLRSRLGKPSFPTWVLTKKTIIFKSENYEAALTLNLIDPGTLMNVE